MCKQTAIAAILTILSTPLRAPSVLAQQPEARLTAAEPDSQLILLAEISPHNATVLAADAGLQPIRGVRAAPPTLKDITFVGLRRISREALLDKMLSRPGFAFSNDRLAHDLHTLGRLGWFDDSMRVRLDELSDAPGGLENPRNSVELTFFLQELSFLTSVEYGGSRLLSKAQIDKLFADKMLTPRFGEPENRAALHRAAKEIEAALNELGHPDARVSIQEQISPQSTVKVRFVINDGPHVPLARVSFIGDSVIPEKRLRAQMRQLRPQAFFAGLRGKNAYTREALEQDREHLLAYYRNHGYPEARVGTASTWQFQAASRHWLVWPHTHRTQRNRLALLVPVEAGPFYTIDAVQVSESLATSVAANRRQPPASRLVRSGMPYSSEAVENLRRAWQVQLRGKLKKNSAPPQSVEAIRAPDTAAHTMRVVFRMSDSPPYVVRRLQFEGLRRFPDRYLRKRIPLKEGAAFDDRLIEAGLARLARTGYFKPIKKEDIHVATNDLTHTVDVTIRVEELGQQRVSFIGGRGQFGSTLGIAYMLYNVLDRQELLSSRVEAGPETLQLALSLAKEGFLGSRGTLALSVFNMFLRPQLTGTVKGPFFNQHTEGIIADYTYALTNSDTLSLDYGLSHSSTQYSLAVPPGLTGLPPSLVNADTSSHSLGLGWDRNTGYEQIGLAGSVSGGLLGGSENLLRGKAEYARIFHDPLLNPHNAWAFHSSFNAVGSYSGSMPLYARGFVGDQFMRGLTDGELGPDAIVASTSASGSTIYSASPAGANLITAVNAEYRIPLGARVEAAPFFDLGSGRLLPNWLGPNRPSLLDSTNGLLHASTGLQFSWTVPGVGVPVRVYYALNVLRLNRLFALPDGSLFRARNRFSALGWGLGSMF